MDDDGDAGIADQRTSRKTAGRRIVAAVCGVLAVVLVPLAVIASWARATVFESDTAERIARDVVADPQVSDGIAAHLADTVMEYLTLPDDLVTELPPALDRLRPVLRSALDVVVERAFERALSDPAAPDVVAGLAARAHAAAMDLLTGDGVIDGVSVADGEVSVNLLPLIARGLRELDRIGLPGLAEVPELAVGGNPSDQIAQLEDALGHELPDDFGQLVVYRSDRVAAAEMSVANAQTVMTIVRRAIWLLVVGSVVSTVLAIALAADRLAMTFRVAVGIVITLVFVGVATREVVERAPDLAADPTGRAVIEITLSDATRGLSRLVTVIGVAAALVAIVIVVRRGRRPGDVAVLGAAAVGLAVVVLLGLNPWSIVAAVALAAAVGIAATRQASSLVGTAP